MVENPYLVDRFRCDYEVYHPAHCEPEGKGSQRLRRQESL